MTALGHHEFAVFGWSDGANIGALMAVNAPQRIRRLVVWGGNSYLSAEEIAAFQAMRSLSSWSQREADAMRQIYGDSLDDLWERYVVGLEDLYSAGGDIYRSGSARIVMSDDGAARGEGPAGTIVSSRTICEGIPGSLLHVFPEGKHRIHAKYAAEFNQLTAAFFGERSHVFSINLPATREIEVPRGPGHCQLNRSLGLFDSTMIVAGSMIGSGIFIVAGEMAREVGSSGWMLAAWVIAGVLTLAAALSYGELAAMMPHAGGQYVYLREAFSPLWGFLYGWTLFLVIQTGTIAASSVGFSRYLGVLGRYCGEQLIPADSYFAHLRCFPFHRAGGRSGGDLVSYLDQYQRPEIWQGGAERFTSMKIGSLLAVIVIGILIGWNASVVKANFGDAWTPRGFTVSGYTASPLTAFGMLVGLCTAQIGSLFAADAWNNITFSAGEVQDPSRNVPLSLALGTFIVIGLYLAPTSPISSCCPSARCSAHPRTAWPPP